MHRKRLGHPDNIALHIGQSEHGYSKENRQAMYRWFNRVTGVSQDSSEPKLTIEKDETLWCTKSGQVTELKPATVFDFTRDKALQLHKQRGNVAAGELPRLIQKVLNLPGKLPATPEFRILRDTGKRGYPRPHATTYAIETEPNVFAISYLLSEKSHPSRPPRTGRQATLYVSHRSADAELRSEVWLRERIAKLETQPVFTCDVRGIGESLPNGYDQIDVIAKGWGATIAILAATLSDSLHGPIIQSVTLQQHLESFHSLATHEEYQSPLAYLPFNVLSHFDIPDCLAALAKKRVELVD